MAISNDPFTAADLAAVIPELWQPLVLKDYRTKGQAAKFFRDLSPWAMGGGDTVHVPDLFTNDVTVQTQSTQATEVTTNSPAQTDTTLSINLHKYVALLMGDKDVRQVLRNMYDLSALYAEKSVGALVDQKEADIFAEHSNITTNTVGDTASVLNDSEVRQAIEKLATLNTPLDETAFFFHPYTYWTQIVAIQKYYDASQFGAPSVTKAGALGGSPDLARDARGTLFGIPVFTSSKVVNTLLAVRNLLAHRDAIMTAATDLGNGGPLRVQSANWLENLAVLTIVDHVYGIKTTREKAAVRLSASNAFIAS